MARRNAVGTYTLPDTNTNLIVLTFSTGASGAAAAGYLRARGGNAAAIFVGQDTDLSGEPRVRLAAGESYPLTLEYEAVIALYCRGSAADVLEFISDAAE